MRVLLIFSSVFLVLLGQVRGDEEHTAESLFVTSQFTKDNLDGSLEGYDKVSVQTSSGVIHGRSKENDAGEKTVTFLGIPFAEPPVGELRFVPPKPVKSYDDFEAFKFGEACLQSLSAGGMDNFLGSEDCLTLNVFTGTDDFEGAGRPVMVWIHGGGFILGSSRTYDPAPLIKKGVIVVTINYRLGGFGFLTFGNDIAPGNLAIRDQIEALRWIKTHISNFGGDPDRVTIFGESAGGMSGSSLQMSPAAAGLFSAAILQSGTMLMRRETVDESKPYRVAQALANTFDSPSKALDSELLAHLQKLPADKFLQATDTEYQPFWAPYQDESVTDPVLPLDFLQAYMHGYFNKVPTMTGTVKNDGGLIFAFTDLNLFINYLAHYYVGTTNKLNASEITEDTHTASRNVFRYYNGDNYNLLEVLPGYVEMLTDSIFLAPERKVAEYVSKYAPVYNYRFNYAGANTLLGVYTGASPQELQDKKEDLEALKPVHGDELSYLFDFLPLETEDDLKVREVMTDYWTNFAKYQDPSPAQDESLTNWEPYSTEKNYLNIDLEPKMDKNLKKESMNFWQSIHWDKRECERSYLPDSKKPSHKYFNGLSQKMSEFP